MATRSDEEKRLTSARAKALARSKYGTANMPWAEGFADPYKKAAAPIAKPIKQFFDPAESPYAKSAERAAPFAEEKKIKTFNAAQAHRDYAEDPEVNLVDQDYAENTLGRLSVDPLRNQPEAVILDGKTLGYKRMTDPLEQAEYGKAIYAGTPEGTRAEQFEKDLMRYGKTPGPPEVPYNAAIGGKPGPIAGSPAGGELPSQMDVDQYIAERQAKRAEQKQATQQRKLESPNYRALRPGQRRKLLRAYESDMDDIASKVASRRITPRAASQMLGAKKAYYSEAFGMGPKDLASEQGLNYRQAARETALMERGKQSDAAMMARDLVSRDTQLEAASMRNQPQAKWMKASRPIMEDGMKTGEEPIFVDPETERMFVPGEGGSEAEIPPVAGARKDRDGIWWVKNADGTSTRVK